MLRLILYIAFLGLVLSGYAQKLIIDHPSYANKLIKFSRQTDPLTYEKELLAEAVGNDSGRVEIHLNLSETQKIYTHIGQFEAYLYVEPSKSYDLLVPAYEQRSFRDVLNPYFEFQKLHLGVKNPTSDDINKLIISFNEIYFPIYNKYVSTTISTKDFSALADDLRTLDGFSNKGSDYFKTYVHFKKGELAFMARQHDPYAISKDYFAEHNIKYRNESYNELFASIYKGYLFKYGSKEIRRQTFKAISQTVDLDSTLLAMKSDSSLLKSDLREWVLLSFLYQELFDNNFKKETILALIEQIQNRSSVRLHREVAQRILSRLKSLQVGEQAPKLVLKNSVGESVTLDSLRGKYVYLNFATSKSYTCLQEFQVIKHLYDKHQSRLEFVTVFVEEKLEDMQYTLQNIQASWIGVFYNQEVLERYKVKAFPTNFLIAPDGSFILSPAPSITNDFERNFFEIMRSRGDI